MTDKDKDKDKGTDVATAQGYDYGANAGRGLENVSQDDYVIPFMNLLQALSPEVADGTVDNAKAGMLMNTVSKELIEGDVGFVFQPTRHDKAWVEWTPRSGGQGGKFVKAHSEEDEIICNLIDANNGSKIPPIGDDGKRGFKIGDNDVLLTHYLYGNILTKDGKEIDGVCVMSFTKTKISVYRDLITSIGMARKQPPLFAFRLLVRTVKQTSDSGTFYNYNITPFGGNWLDCLIDPVGESHLIEKAIKMSENVAKGKVKADHENEGSSASSAGDAGAGKGGSANKGGAGGAGEEDDEIPF